MASRQLSIVLEMAFGMALISTSATPLFANNVHVSTGNNIFTIVSDTTGQIIAPLPVPAPVVSSLADNWAVIPGATWIGPSPDQSNATRPASSYLGSQTVYETTFDLAGLDPTSASIAMMLSADDFVTVKLNGNEIFSYNGPMWSNTFNFANAVSSNFQNGLNTLSFLVTNQTGGPTGLIVLATITADSPGAQVPEPATAIAVVLGLAALGLWRRRRSFRD